ERPGGKLYLARGAPIALRVQPLDLLLQVDVAGNLLEGALQMPDGLVNRAALVIALADADVGDEVVGVGAQHALEDVGRVLVVLLLKQRTGEQLVDLDVFGIDLQDMAALGDDFREGVTFEAVLNVVDVSAKADL